MRNPNPVFSARAAEQLLCGWALQNDRWLDDLSVALGPEHFEDSRYGALFGAILAAKAKGLRATPDTLESWAENSGVWRMDELFSLSGKGRCGSSDEFETAARNIVANADKRAVRQAVHDADAYLLENTDEDAAVLATSIEGLIRGVPIGGAKPATRIGDLSTSYRDKLRRGEVGGIRTGFKAIDDRHGAFMGGELIIIPGEPGSGKTTLASNIARRFSDSRGANLRGHFASYEMGEDQLIPRMWSAISFQASDIEAFEYKSLRRADRGDVSDETLDQCDAVLRTRFANLVVDATSAQTLAELEASVRRTKRELGGLDYIVVDYLQRMRPTNPKAERRLQVEHDVAGLKSLAKRHNVPVFALATISRANQTRSDKRPVRSDMRESGAIEYEADAILAVFRPARELEVELQRLANDPDASDEDIFELSAKLDKVRNDLELITLKARQGDEGIDFMRAHLGHDTVRDSAKPQRGGR